MRILLNDVNKLDAFFEKIKDVPGVAVIKTAKTTVNAHSIMGVLTLDLTKPLTLITSKKYLKLFKEYEDV